MLHWTTHLDPGTQNPAVAGGVLIRGRPLPRIGDVLLGDALWSAPPHLSRAALFTCDHLCKSLNSLSSGFCARRGKPVVCAKPRPRLRVKCARGYARVFRQSWPASFYGRNSASPTTVIRPAILTPRIAASANVTLMQRLQRSIRCRLIGPARWLSRLARREGLWADRALHSPSRPQPPAMGPRSGCRWAASRRATAGPPSS